MYFITGLSQRGAIPIMIGTCPNMENMTMVIDRVCPGTRKGSGSGKVGIETISDMALKLVLHAIMRVVGSQANMKP